MLNFTNYNIPEHTQGALSRYIEFGYMPGDFLTAVLSNDLFGAVGRADSENLAAIPDIVKFVYNRMPANSWGNRKIVQEYAKQVMEQQENA